MAPAKILSDRSSSSSQDNRLPDYSEQAPAVAPAVQDLPPDLSERLGNLNLTQLSGTGINVSPDQCIAHLKFLEAVHHLKETVGNIEGLFGIAEPDTDPNVVKGVKHSKSVAEERANLAKVRVREKRWAVYVARAVKRFEKWWETAVPSSKLTEPKMLTTEELTSKSGIDQAGYEGIRITTMGLKDRLPPLDVLMVWHAYLLNPRCFFEDCFRYQKLDFFATPFPFEAIDGCIDVVSFEFRGTDAAQNRFVSTTGFYWDNLNDSLTTPIQCGGCGTINEVLWTTDSQWRSFMDEMSKGNGLADAKFWHNCTSCRLRIDHDHLRVNKFLNDAGLCYFKDVPLPGTLLNPDGMPEEAQKHINLGKPYNNFPNLLIKAGLVDVMREVDGVGTTSWRMEKIRDGFEDALKNKKFIRKAKIGSTVIGRERNAVRKVMSRYWYNSSPFALDLAGAVIRQGSFIDKMHDIDWLHSPALKGTMKRLIEKYSRFFQIMTNNKYNMAVPTLDVDLAWHTHQLNAADYYRFSIAYASKYIDHDDKVEEVALSDAFTWTSQKYADMFGEPYSECRCWYCEAVREASSSRLDGLFKPKKKEAKAKLHESEDIATDPLKSAHISAHNAVRDLDGEAKAAVHAAKLDKAYNKAAAKAKKKGQVPPSRDQYYAAYYWGYPMPMPIYYPYAVPVGVGGDCHASDPCAYNSAPGSYGACAAGSCGGMAAAGGSCGGGSGGACGSGGGGCGSGGGGGGCGGGGGGGCGGGGS